MPMSFRTRIFVITFLLSLVVFIWENTKDRYTQSDDVRQVESGRTINPLFEVFRTNRVKELTISSNTATILLESTTTTDIPKQTVTERKDEEVYVDELNYDYPSEDWSSSTRDVPPGSVSTIPTMHYFDDDYDYHNNDNNQSTTTTIETYQTDTELSPPIRAVTVPILLQTRRSGDGKGENLDSGKINEDARKQAARKRHILDVCNRHLNTLNRKAPSSFVNFNTLLSPKHKIAYCQIQKVGSTFWKRVVEFIRRKDIMVYHSPFDVKFKDLSLPRILENKDIKDKILKKSFKFMFVRDPYERLFSGYIDKFFSPNTIFWKGLGRYIQNMTRERKYYSRCGSDISFKEFVEYVIRGEESKMTFREKHFSPQYEHCLPCQTHFDYIGKMENPGDTKYMLNKLESLAHIPIFRGNLESQIVNDTIHDMTRRLYVMKSDIQHCESMYLGMLRTWRNFQIRGILNKNAIMPFNRRDADHIPMRTFEQAVFTSHNSFGSRTSSAMNKKEAMNEAYRTLSRKTIEKIKTAFLFDFELFDYESNPTRLFANKTTGFSYFKL